MNDYVEFEEVKNEAMDNESAPVFDAEFVGEPDTATGGERDIVTLLIGVGVGVVATKVVAPAVKKVGKWIGDGVTQLKKRNEEKKLKKLQAPEAEEADEEHEAEVESSDEK